MRRYVSALAACFCVVPSAHAQQGNIPRDFVLALFAYELPFDSVSKLEILVGEAPKDLPLPKLNFPVLGTLKQDHGATIVYRVTGDLKKARNDLLEQLRRAGWKRPEMEKPSETGFVGIESEMVELMPMCRDNAMVTVHPATVRAGVRVLKVSFHEIDGCGSGIGLMQYSGLNTEETPLPKLEPPRNAQVWGSQTPGMVSSFATNAFIISDLTTAQIVDHYSAQMHASGWSSRGATVGEFATVHTWRIAQDGKEWMASMITTALAERQHVVEINVFNLSRLQR